MLLHTEEFVTDAVGQPEPITVTRRCARVVVQEQSQLGTADFWIYGVKSDGTPDSNPAKYAAGKQKEFLATPGYGFFPGQTIAFIAAATGSLTMSREEYGNL